MKKLEKGKGPVNRSFSFFWGGVVLKSAAFAANLVLLIRDELRPGRHALRPGGEPAGGREPLGRELLPAAYG